MGVAQRGTTRWGWVALGVACLVAPCAGWGCAGHELTAKIAQAQLSPTANAGVAALMRIESDQGAELSTLACWADEIRSQPQYRWSARLHFVDTPDWACTFDYARDCPGDVCAVGAVANYTARLAEGSGLAPAQRLEALKFLVHFVGDLHQPLHVAFSSDRGGNLVNVEFNTSGIAPEASSAILTAHLAMEELRGDLHCNLHHLWDDEIINESIRLLRVQDRATDWQEYGDVLLTKFNLTAAKNAGPPFVPFCPAAAPAAVPATISRRALRAAGISFASADLRGVVNHAELQGCASGWARESVNFACEDAYVDDADDKLDLQSCTRRDACRLGAPYYERAAPVVEMQLAAGGVRLADVLNRVLDGSGATVQ